MVTRKQEVETYGKKMKMMAMKIIQWDAVNNKYMIN
jgi:hypothetical protein